VQKSTQSVSTESPPHDPEAERAVLGCCLLSSEAVEAVLSLPAAAFYLESHRAILDGIRRLHGAGRVVDIVSVCDVLRNGNGSLDGVIRGGSDYVTRLVDAVTSPGRVEEYAGIVRRLYEERQARRGVLAAGDALRAGKPAGEVVAAFQEQAAKVDAGQADDTLPQGERLTRICERDVREFFRDQFGTPHVALPIKGHLELWPTWAGRFREAWLAARYRELYGSTPGREALNQARIQVDARCYEGPERELHNRVAEEDGAIWYDLASQLWQGVKVTSDGWSIEPLPACFRRYKHQAGQVTPETGGDPRRLLDFCNVPSDSECLFLVLVASWLVPRIPHPILILHGQQGTGKSETFRMLKRLIDPARHDLDLLALPKDEDRAVQTLDHHWFAPFDNISKLPDWCSDMLCRAVTGEGQVKRALYTDDGDFIRAYRRCIALNGINNPVFRGDLLDRAILFETEPLGDVVPEELLGARWENALSGILGGFFDAVAAAVKVVGGVSQESVSEFRMADFARWGVGLALGLGYPAEEFLASYREAVHTKFVDAIEGDAFAAAIRDLVLAHGTWEGPAAELLERVNPQLDGKRRKDMPRGPIWISRALTRIAPGLCRVGIHCESWRGQKGRRIRLQQVGSNGPDDGGGLF